MGNKKNRTYRINVFIYSILFSGFGAFSFLLLVNYSNLPSQVNAVINTFGSLVFFIATFNFVGYATIKLSSWINKQFILNSITKWKIAGSYALVMLILLAINYGFLVLAKVLANVSEPLIFPNGGIRILIIVWLVELVILGLIISNRSMKDALKYQLQATKLQQENDKAKYTALQNQLNPHFLFNSLNTLIAEIEYNPQNAIGITKNLSNVYRYVLQVQDKPLVSLADEINFTHSYLFLYSVRLGNCISVSEKISNSYMDYLIAPLTLQLLVENIIKHNTINNSNPMQIEFNITDNYLVVSNSLNLKKNNNISGIGLKNLSMRCKLILAKDIEITTHNNIFTVKVPLIYE